MKKLKDYTEAEKSRFDDMQRRLTEYNRGVMRGEVEVATLYSEKEMEAYSRYREMVLYEQGLVRRSDGRS